MWSIIVKDVVVRSIWIKHICRIVHGYCFERNIRQKRRTRGTLINKGTSKPFNYWRPEINSNGTMLFRASSLVADWPQVPTWRLPGWITFEFNCSTRYRTERFFIGQQRRHQSFGGIPFKRRALVTSFFSTTR